MGCLLTVLTVFFEAQKLLILRKSNLSIFSFIARAFVVICRKSWPNPRWWRFTLRIFLRVLCLALTFRSLMCMFWSRGPTSFFCTEMFCCPCKFLKRLFFYHWIGLVSLLKNQMPISVKVYFWSPNSIQLIYMSILIRVLHCLNYCSFVASFKFVSVYSQILLFFKRSGYPGHPEFHDF